MAGPTAPLTPVGFNDLTEMTSVVSTDQTFVREAATALLKRASISAIGNAARRPISITLTANQNDWNPTGLAAADHIRVTASITGSVVKVTGLQGGVAGRIISIENVSTQWLVLSGNDSNSTAAYRFAFGGMAPVIVLGYCETVVLIYDATVSRWKILSIHIGGARFGGSRSVYEDPLMTADYTTRLTTSVSVGTVTRSAADGPIGEVALATGASATGRAGIGTADVALIATPTSAPMIFGGMLKNADTVSDGTNTYTIRAGLLDSLSAEPTDGIFLRYVHSANSGKWLLVARKNGSETTADTGITYAVNAVHRYAIVTYGGLATPAVDLYMTDSTGALDTMAWVCSVANANVPTTVARAYGIGMSIIHAGAGTTTRTCYCYPWSLSMFR